MHYPVKVKGFKFMQKRFDTYLQKWHFNPPDYKDFNVLTVSKNGFISGLGIFALFLSKKLAIWKITNFLLIFAISLFLKEGKSNRSFRCSFEKSDKKSNHSFALF